MKRTQASSRYITRKAFNRLATLLFVIVLSISSGAMLHANAMNGSDAETDRSSDTKAAKQEYKKLCVEPGDTLWEIAKKYGDPDKDVRFYIRDIKELNELDSSAIQAGQILLLP
ncbi:LysM peptidoglycan-binding domain-containing protein [Paenibacillus alkalitolerans]|uniref:LysM peptidoglycan-binding domain-containing protein n=1 Tax=Paenibacillus alkalitolerans TaxID=2799335 RepID=UPI0018F7432C|nr:LysM peptidoglycan-binding domain-containing protein [Paenibacillus alkalitolerans]